MSYFGALLLIAVAGSTALLGQVVSAADLGAGREVQIHLGVPTDDAITKPFEKQPPRVHRIVVTKHRRIPEAPPRQRNPVLSSEQLVVVAFDAQNREVSRIVVPDPRLIRAETIGPPGNLQSELIYRKSADFIVLFPDDPGVLHLKFYHPRWTGSGFTLEFIGEAQLP